MVPPESAPMPAQALLAALSNVRETSVRRMTRRKAQDGWPTATRKRDGGSPIECSWPGWGLAE